MSTNSGGAQIDLYARHEKIQAREVEGTYSTLRNISTVVLLGIFYGLPWLPWDDRQAILFDLPARKFYIFGLTFWPQDFFYLTWLLIIAALTLFFVTAIAGRVFCGYACPQTIWTAAFVRMERWVEGPRSKRLKLDKAPWSGEKVLKKTTKHGLWLAFALFTGFTFVGYFTPITELGSKVLAMNLGGWELFWVLFYGFATYGNAGHMREQVCKYMCPYARFQSAMFDHDSLVIAYDEARGEQRGSRKRGEDPASKGLGDCIDCQVCVQVCPTGIDIREGLQYECIACGACIDGCNQIMAKMGYEPNLVKYTTQHNLDGGKARVLRTRTIIYGTLLSLLIAGFVTSVATRDLLHMDVIRDRNALYRTTTDGRIENVYTLKILNKDQQVHTLTIDVEGLTEAQLQLDPPAPTLQPGELASINARVSVPANAMAAGGHDVIFILNSNDTPELGDERDSRFILPVR